MTAMVFAVIMLVWYNFIMDYLIVSLVSFALSFLIFRQQLKIKQSDVSIKFRNSQSSIFETIKLALPVLDFLKKKRIKTQASEYELANTIKVLVLDGFAYWIKDNAVYSADIHNNEIDKNSTKKLDIIGMDNIQLDKIMFIVEKLTEGLEDDRGNSGYSQL